MNLVINDRTYSINVILKKVKHQSIDVFVGKGYGNQRQAYYEQKVIEYECVILAENVRILIPYIIEQKKQLKQECYNEFFDKKVPLTELSFNSYIPTNRDIFTFSQRKFINIPLFELNFENIIFIDDIFRIIFMMEDRREITISKTSYETTDAKCFFFRLGSYGNIKRPSQNTRIF